ncbi:hypothetical protein Vqi01_49930 [Micromonospora qiuiae]|uniref:Uncharacterized protein n=1 Tax=Micromonospora qiuiae TaxID=502268 RepID=A0ABQ4JJY0_9ACTN|nr:hypothetical protein Vqi01_49930 [Micromonospora qiuiae]
MISLCLEVLYERPDLVRHGQQCSPCAQGSVGVAPEDAGGVVPADFDVGDLASGVANELGKIDLSQPGDGTPLGQVPAKFFARFGYVCGGDSACRAEAAGHRRHVLGQM